MTLSKTPLALLISAAGLLGQAQAANLVFDSAGDTGGLLFATTRETANLNALVTFTLTSLAANTAVFDVSIANNTLVSNAGTNRLMSFGIDIVSPALTGASDASAMWDAGIGQTLPGFQTVDLCFWASNNCSGGAINNGLGEATTSPVFQLTLTTAGNFLTSGVTFTSPYGAKFQDVGTGGNSWEFAGCIAGTPGCGGGGGGGGGNVPEPGSLALVGLALLAAGAGRRLAK